MNITKENYNVSDLFFLNQNVIRKKYTNNSRNPIDVYEIEKISIEDKIKMIDDFENGIATQMLNLIRKFIEESDSLPKGSWGEIKTVSFKAWVNRNNIERDRRTVLSTYKYGRYTLFDREHQSLSLICGKTEYGYSMPYTDDDIVNQWFHDFVNMMIRFEKDWFNENDPHMLKLKEVKKYGDQFGVFNCKIINDIVYNRGDATEEQLDYFIELYKEMENIYNKKTIYIEEFLGKENMY